MYDKGFFYSTLTNAAHDIIRNEVDCGSFLQYYTLCTKTLSEHLLFPWSRLTRWIQVKAIDPLLMSLVKSNSISVDVKEGFKCLWTGYGSWCQKHRFVSRTATLLGFSSSTVSRLYQEFNATHSCVKLSGDPLADGPFLVHTYVVLPIHPLNGTHTQSLSQIHF